MGEDFLLIDSLSMLDLRILSILAICFVTTSLHYFVGAQFLRTGIFTRIVAGLAFNASLIAFLVAFSAALAKPFAIFVLLGSMGISIYCGYTKKSFFYDTKLNIKVVLQLVFVMLLYFFLCGIYFSDINISPKLFDGHQNYFSGVSLEILNSEYYSRLRILDNYPVEWGRYHFFNGAITSLPQLFLHDRALVTFMVAKICILIFFLMSIAELGFRGLSSRHFLALVIICLAYIFTMLPYQTWWTVFTNAYSSIALLAISFLCWKNGQFRCAIFFAMCLGLSTSRSLVPAWSLVGVMLYELYRNFINFPRFLGGSNFPLMLIKKFKLRINTYDVYFYVAMGVILLATFAMIFSGSATGSPFSRSIENFTHIGWLSKMSPAFTSIDEEMRNSSLSFIKPSKLWHVFWLVVLAFFAGVKHLHKKIIYSLFLISFLVLYLGTYKMQLLFLYYVYPITLCILLAPKNLKILVLVFTLVSLMQIYIFDASISIPNFAAIEWLVLLGLLASIKLVDKKIILCLFLGFTVMLYFQGLPLSPFNLFKLNRFENTTYVLPATYFDFSGNDDVNSVYCFSGSDGDAALAAARGQRVTYSDEKSDRYSVSVHFGVPNNADLDYVNQICK